MANINVTHTHTHEIKKNQITKYKQCQTYFNDHDTKNQNQQHTENLHNVYI